ncbi:MAG: hypothetical protein JXA67_11040 [Micromonosporaceae bacterium]|nr:hypothetical protein [Micromonosporaceae bacterium]
MTAQDTDTASSAQGAAVQPVAMTVAGAGEVAEHYRARHTMPAGHRWVVIVAAALATVCLAGGGVAISRVFDLSGGGGRLSSGAQPEVPVADGWRLESSLGIEIAVPASWGINDYGCNMTEKSSVVRGSSAALLCFTQEPAGKEIAEIRALSGVPEPTPPAETVRIGGVVALRSEGRLDDGRFTGRVTVPDRDVVVLVRARSDHTVQSVLDSVRLVDVDHVGCELRRPDAVVPGRAAAVLVTPEPVAAGVCYYGGPRSDGRLHASIELPQQAARDLAAAMNAAQTGVNPDVSSDQCVQTSPKAVDAVLRFRGQDEVVETVAATFSSCEDRGFDNGVRSVPVTRSLIDMFMAPLRVGYALGGDLPE